MLEHEKKALLTKEEYDLLMASCKGMADRKSTRLNSSHG